LVNIAFKLNIVKITQQLISVRNFTYCNTKMTIYFKR